MAILISGSLALKYSELSITYDTIGNPLNDGTWTYEWEKGRQLKKMTKPGMIVEFKYNHNGLRTQKKVVENGVTTTYDYTLHGKLITHLTKSVVDSEGNEAVDHLHFFYDAQSKPTFVEYNGEMYRYIHNLQGDIVAIVDNAGNLVVEYKYDAWGKPISMTGALSASLGILNPFRYRGYVYDEETGLYYLRSRYYNPVWGRFINSDTLLGEVGAVGSHNQFAYCGNNPVAFYDPNGRSLVLTGLGYATYIFLSALGILGASSIDGTLPGRRTTSRPNVTRREKNFLSIVGLAALASSVGIQDNSRRKDNDPDKKYYLAVATGTDAPRPVSSAMDVDDVNIALHGVPDLQTQYIELAAGYDIVLEKDKFVYGVMTVEKEDAEEAVSFFGNYKLCPQKLVDNMRPHFHATYHHDIHFWFEQ